VGRVSFSINHTHRLRFRADKNAVERRREPRFKISKKITLQVLDRMSGPSLGKRIEGQVTDVSGSGLRLRLPLPVPCGALVEIVDKHTLILGEVCRCVPDEGAYAAGIRVKETLPISEHRLNERTNELRLNELQRGTPHTRS